MAVAAAALQVHRESEPGARVTLTVLFLAEITSGAIAGGKESFIVAALAVAIPFVVARRKIHKAPHIRGPGLLPGYRPVQSGVSQHRPQPVRAAVCQPGDRHGAGRPAGRRLALGDIACVFCSSADSILTRIREIEIPAIIVQRTPTQISFENPSSSSRLLSPTSSPGRSGRANRS